MKTLLKTLTAAAALCAVTSSAHADEWNNWRSKDSPNGSGDYEKIEKHYSQGWISCANPTDMQVRRKSDGVLAEETGQVVTMNLSYGFVCRNANQSGNCADYEARFACPDAAEHIILPRAGFGRVMHFDGVDDRVDVQDAFGGASSGTLELRVMPLEQRAATLAQLGGVDVLRINIDNKVEVVMPDGSVMTSANSLALATWAHIALVQDADAQTVSLYINGILNASQSTATVTTTEFSCGDTDNCETVTGCPTQIDGDSAYLLCGEDMARNFDSARSFCQAQGADLVIIDDADENALVNTAADMQTWIGYQRDGSWQTIHGGAVGYSNWNSGEPNGSNGFCGEMYTSGTWNDRACANANRPFVCEAGAISAPGSLLNLAGDLTLGFDATGAMAALKGNLDEVRVFDSARSVDDIYRERYLAPSTANLRVRLEFQELSDAPTNTVDAATVVTMDGDPARVEAIDYALESDAGSGAATIANTPWYGESDVTIAGWVKAGSGGSIISRGGTDILRVDDVGTLSTHILPAGVLYASEAVNPNYMAHVAFTYESSTSTATLYANGVTVAQYVSSLSTFAGDLVLAADLTGQLDDLRIYSRVLTEAELVAEKMRALSGNESDLVAAYAFDEGTGSTAIDLMGRHHATYTSTPAWTVEYGDEDFLTIDADNAPITGHLLFSGDGARIRCNGGVANGALLCGIYDGFFDYTQPDGPSEIDTITYYAENDDYTSPDRTLKLGVASMLTLPVGDLTIVAEQIPEPKTLTIDYIPSIQAIQLGSNYSGGYDGDEAPHVYLNGYAPGYTGAGDDYDGQYDDRLTVDVGDDTLHLQFDGYIRLDHEGRVEVMAGDVQFDGGSISLLSGMQGPTFEIGYDYAANFNTYGLPLDDDRKFIYFIIAGNDSISWGSSTISSGVGTSILAIDHTDPAVLIYTEAFTAMGLGDYINDAGVGFSHSGNFDVEPTMTWGNEDYMGPIEGHVYTSANFYIPTKVPNLSVNVDGQILVDIDAPDDMTPANFMETPRRFLANGDFGLSYGAGPWSLNWQFASSSAQYDRDEEWFAISGHLAPQTLEIIPGVIEVDIEDMAYGALRFSDEALLEGAVAANFDWHGIKISGELTLGADGGTFDGHVNLPGTTVTASGYFDEHGASITGSIYTRYSIDALGSVALDGELTVSTSGATADVDAKACLPKWLGGDCFSVGATVSVNNSGFTACADLPLVGNNCFSL